MSLQRKEGKVVYTEEMRGVKEWRRKKQAQVNRTKNILKIRYVTFISDIVD